MALVQRVRSSPACAAPRRSHAIPIRRGALTRVSSATAAKATALNLHSGETTIVVPFNQESAAQLDKAMQQLLQTFAAKAKVSRPQRWEALELRVTGTPGLAYVEFFSNPNAANTAFDAKVLITMATPEGVQVTTETRLSNLKSDLDAYLSGH